MLISSFGVIFSGPFLNGLIEWFRCIFVLKERGIDAFPGFGLSC